MLVCQRLETCSLLSQLSAVAAASFSHVTDSFPPQSWRQSWRGRCHLFCWVVERPAPAARPGPGRRRRRHFYDAMMSRPASWRRRTTHDDRSRPSALISDLPPTRIYHLGCLPDTPQCCAGWRDSYVAPILCAFQRPFKSLNKWNVLPSSTSLTSKTKSIEVGTV